MHQKIVCPYYGKNEDECDVGCGYISPHDVSVIIKHCSSAYRDCLKFNELSERPQATENPANPAAEPRCEKTPQPEAQGASGDQDEPSAWGFLALGFTLLVLGFFVSGTFEQIGATGILLLYCGVWQVLVGVSEWKRTQAFGAVAFSAGGLFSLSLLPMLILPRTGWGFAPEDMALSAYLAMWSIFVILLFIGASQYRIILQAPFGCFALLIALLGAGSAIANPVLLLLSGTAGVVGGLIGLYAGAALLLARKSSTCRLPLGPRRKVL